MGIDQQFRSSCLGHTPGGLSPLPEVWNEDQQALRQYACLREGSHTSSWEHRGSLPGRVLGEQVYRQKEGK